MPTAPEADLIPRAQYLRRLGATLIRPGFVTGLATIARAKPEQSGSFASQLETLAASRPDVVALKFEGQSWTWSEFNRRCNRYAHALAAHGVAKGDVVALSLTNRPEYLVAAMGALKLGASLALVNTALRGASLAHCIEIVSPQAVIVGEELLDQFTELEGGISSAAPTSFFVPDSGAVSVPAASVDLAAAAEEASAENLPVTDSIKLGDPAVYIYTSGTTGLPKAALTDHRRLQFGGLTTSRVMRRLTEEDTVFLVLPLYHSSGLMGAWAGCVYSGASLALTRRFSATSFWEEARKCEATTFYYVGEILRFLYNQPPSANDRDHSVRSILGAGLRVEIWDDFKSRFGIDEVYELWGATESPSGFFNLFNFDRTCGWSPTPWRAVEYDPGTQEPLRGPDGRLRKVGPGGEGLLLIKITKRTPYRGYLDEEASERKVIRDAFEDGDAWFNSGDVVLNQGSSHVRFVDRLGDTFRWRSENVATTEVEGELADWPGIADCAVYGVEVPGMEGRCGMAMVIPSEGTELDLDGLARRLRDNLAPHAVPRFLRIGTEFDMTGSFRHKKENLKREGYDPSVISEPLFVLGADDSTWRPITPEVGDAIATGEIRL